MRVAAVVLLFATGASSGNVVAQDSTAIAQATVLRVDNPRDRPGIIIFSDGFRFETTLMNLTVVETLRAERKRPYLVLTSTRCDDCDEPLRVFVHSPSDGAVEHEGRWSDFLYPGRLLDPGDPNWVMRESRMFTGDCVEGSPSAAVWFIRERESETSFSTSVRIVSVNPDDSLRDVRITTAPPDLAATLRRVAAGSCREVRGVDQRADV